MNKDCKHDLFHFHTGKQPHLWACIKCKDYSPKPHPFLREDEIRGLIFFAFACREEFFNKTNAPMVVQLTNLEGGKMELTVSVKAKSAKDLPSELRKAADALEKENGKPTKTRKTDTAAVEEALEASSEEENEELLGEEEETIEEESEEQGSFDDLEEEEEKPAKPAKGAKKVTEKEVNAAAMAHAKKHTRKKTLELFQKKFKVKSITELKPAQWAAAIEALKV